jgi:hypothetical protein
LHELPDFGICVGSEAQSAIAISARSNQEDVGEVFQVSGAGGLEESDRKDSIGFR